MDFQIKIERICQRHIFGIFDVLMLRTVTFGMSNATDLEETVQWLHALWSVLLTWGIFSLFQYSAPNAAARHTNRIVSRTMFMCLTHRNPFTLRPNEREAYLNEMFVCMGDDILSSPGMLDQHEIINMALILTGQL